LELPQNYPEKPPTVKFIDPIEHINICSKTGEVKMPLLTEDWSSYFTLYIIIDMIDTLMLEP
jgi:ubiquitin-conjugating enzyme (huntingtin interacting protein 2)